MVSRRSSAAFARAPALFAVALVLVLATAGVLDEFGVPPAVLAALTSAVAFVAVAVLSGITATMDPDEFYQAGRSVPALANGMATAAIIVSSWVFLGLAGAFLRQWQGAVALTIGWSLGVLLLAVLIGPYLWRSGAAGVADFLALRTGSRAVRLVAALAVAAIQFAALVAAIATAQIIAGRLGLAPPVALAGVLAIILAGSMLGGMRSSTATAIVLYVLALIAFTVPAAIVSQRLFGLPVPELTFGHAHRLADIAASVGGDIAILDQARYLPFAPASGFDLMATVASLAAGTAALPHVLARSLTVGGALPARRSAAWTLTLLLALALTAPAYAAFARLAVLDDLVGSALAELPGWAYGLGQGGLLRLCGQAVTTPEALHAACGDSGVLAAGDIALSGDAVVLAFADIASLPAALGQLLALGALAATLAAATAMALTLGNALGHDLYGRLAAAPVSAGRRLFVTRLTIAAAVAAAAYLATAELEVLPLAVIAVALSGGALFMPLVLAVWWRRATAAGIATGILAGFAATAAVVLDRRFPALLPREPLDPTALGLTDLSAAIIGLPAAFLVTVGVSFATAPSGAAAAGRSDRMRHPGGRPLTDGGG